MGTKTMDESRPAAPKLSLGPGSARKPSAPLLGVNGKLDNQAPVEDIYLLMDTASRRRRASIPGGHMGRTPGMPEDEIGNMIAGGSRRSWKKEERIPVR